MKINRDNSTTTKKTDEDFESAVSVIRAVVGTEVSTEKIKYFLCGADGNVEVAINHLLNVIEQDGSNEGRKSPTEAPAIEKMLSDLAEEVKCSLCLGYFNQPVALNCFHTFCAECVEALVSKDKNSVQCPLCRNVFTLPDGGVQGLKHNHYLANIVEKLKVFQVSKTCAECRNSLCSVFCKQCKAFLCEACSKRIHNLKLTQDHVLKPVEDCFFFSEKTRTPKPTPCREDDVLWDLDCVAPCTVDKSQCEDIFNSWLKELWFAPSDLERNSRVHDFKLIYMPYWQFDVETSTKYNCMVGVQLPNALQKQPTKPSHTWTPLLGTCSDKFTNILVRGTNSGTEISLLGNIEPWKTDTLQPFTLKHAQGAEVRPFTVDAETAWRKYGQEKLELVNQESCQKKLQARAKVVSNIQLDTSVSNRKSRRVFLPVYSSSFEYQGKTYRFLINGTTSKVHGQRPYSSSKLASMSLTGLGAAIGLITSRMVPS